MFRVVPVFDEETRKEWPKSSHWTVEGQIEDHLVVSVPFTTSHAQMEVIQNEVHKKLRRKVIVITHNMEFLTAKKLPSSEAASVVKGLEDYAESRARKVEAETSRLEAESQAYEDQALADAPVGTETERSGSAGKEGVGGEPDAGGNGD